MKVKLFYVSKDNWVDSEFEGLYTEKEFEDLKKEIIENYRDSCEYVDDIIRYVDERLVCKAALGREEEEVEEFKAELRTMEEETLEDFINDCVIIYEKEL